MIKFFVTLLSLIFCLNLQAQERFPVRGDSQSDVTVVMFGDFQCPFTKRSVLMINELLAESGKDFKFIFRHYPLPFHAEAKTSAIASVCAQNQGQFWSYFDELFSVDGRDLNTAYFMTTAKKLGLNISKFSKCLKSPEASAEVAQDIKEGELFSVMGTPSFILIGLGKIRRITGAYPKEDFQRYINEVKAPTL